MTIHSEADLLRGASNLDRAILTEIYDHFSSGVFVYAYRLLDDSNLAEDCVSETFLRFLGMVQEGRGPRDHLKAYLYRIAHNWITDLYRQKFTETVELTDRIADPQGEPVENRVEKNIKMKHLRNRIMSLTPDQRLVISLRFIEGWDILQVAAALGKPEGAVKSLQHRALQILKKGTEPLEVNHEI